MSVPDQQATISARGFSDPVRLLSVADAHWVSRHLRHVRDRKPPDWNKARATIDSTIFKLARSQKIVEALRPHLGDDIILWGADSLLLRSRQRHAWHVDIESASADGPCISVWIALRNCSSDSGLSFVRGSHLWGTLLQECAAKDGVQYGMANNETVLSWARQFDSSADLLNPDVRDGEAIVFDGRIWHSAENRNMLRRRHAVLLQYAPADVAIRIPDLRNLDWPFQMKTAPRPQTILVSGRSKGVKNRIVPPPPMEHRDLTSISTSVHQYRLPLAEDRTKGWKPYDPLFGQTGSLELLGYHASVLSPGHCPHPPHTHPEEEILIVLDGEAEILIADSPRDKAPKRQRLTQHQAAYYPSQQHHTIQNVSAGPVTYLMLRWRGSKASTKRPLPTQILDAAAARPGHSGRGLSVQVLAEGPTGLLSKMHVHVSELAPGHGYEPHRDAYDLAIIVLTGKIEILDSVSGPNSVVLIAAGEPHGIFNPTDEPARYLVVELHRNSEFTRGMPRLYRKLQKLARRGIRFARRAISRVRRFVPSLPQ